MCVLIHDWLAVESYSQMFSNTCSQTPIRSVVSKPDKHHNLWEKQTQANIKQALDRQILKSCQA
jgi:hypothetical protein